MSLGLVGRKVGMTRVFTDDGISIPVTVLEVVPNRVTQIKTIENDGYQAVQVTSHPYPYLLQEGFVEILSQNYNYYQILPFIPPLANTVVASLNGILFV